ncbi:hypothetical protein AgCh_040190 [Apium graveolens]
MLRYYPKKINLDTVHELQVNYSMIVIDGKPKLLNLDIPQPSRKIPAQTSEKSRSGCSFMTNGRYENSSSNIAGNKVTRAAAAKQHSGAEGTRSSLCFNRAAQGRAFGLETTAASAAGTNNCTPALVGDGAGAPTSSPAAVTPTLEQTARTMKQIARTDASFKLSIFL